MKRFQLVILCAFAILGGCMNLYTRCPWTNPKIEDVYQCSREAVAFAMIGSFPQMMSDAPDRGWRWENCLTIPFIGLPCAVDAVCEGVIDTVCLPVDWPLSASRKEAK